MTTLTNTCPACGAAPLVDCDTVINGVQTGWDHDARILEPVIQHIKVTRTQPVCEAVIDDQGETVTVCEAPATTTRPHPACAEHAGDDFEETA